MLHRSKNKKLKRDEGEEHQQENHEKTESESEETTSAEAITENSGSQKASARRASVKRRAPVIAKRSTRSTVANTHLDDNELTTITSKLVKNKQQEIEVEEEQQPQTSQSTLITEDDSKATSTKSSKNTTATTTSSKRGVGHSLRRRNSDLSSVVSSTSTTGVSTLTNVSSTMSTKATAIAKLKACIEKLPPNLGSDEHEKRNTRSKLKTLITENHNDSSSSLPPAGLSRVLARRNSKRNTNLEQVQEETTNSDQHIISISNLKKHDEIMDKMVNKKSTTIKPASRITRSRVSVATRSPSPSASSIVSASSVQSASTITSTASTTKRRAVGRAGSTRSSKKTIEKPIGEEHEKQADEHNNAEEEETIMNHDKTLKADDIDTGSVISIASSTASRSTRRTAATKSVPAVSSSAGNTSKITAPSAVNLDRSNSARGYNLRKKSAKNDADVETCSATSSVVELGEDEIANASQTSQAGSAVSSASAASKPVRKTRSSRAATTTIVMDHHKLDKIEENEPASKRVTRSK
jgi:hypothetical protein